jgi:hypothetical protein
MTTLRMTQPNTDRPRRARSPWVAACVVAVTLTGLTGCGSESRPADEAAAELANKERADLGARLPPPAADQIEYDQASCVLTLYQLPASGRWMVQLPGATTPAPAAARHRLPAGVDPDRTLVFYTTPGGNLSTPVSLRQIEKAQTRGHTSQVH